MLHKVFSPEMAMDNFDLREKKMKKFTETDVRRVLDYFCDTDTEFTALDVRDELRMDNLYALQGEVSPMVHELMSNEFLSNYDYEKVDNGTYCKYVPVEEVFEGEDDGCDEVYSGETYSSEEVVELVIRDNKVVEVRDRPEWVNPIGKVITFVYYGGSYPKEVRKCRIVECLDTRIVGEILGGDPGWNPVEPQQIRNFSYKDMEDVKYV